MLPLLYNRLSEVLKDRDNCLTGNPDHYGLYYVVSRSGLHLERARVYYDGTYGKVRSPRTLLRVPDHCPSKELPLQCLPLLRSKV